MQGYNSFVMPNSHPLEFFSHSPQETRKLGMQLGVALDAGDVICLQGDLGAGKTTFVQGLAQSWGSIDSVSSPTFVIINQYRRADGAQLFHLDTYRIDSESEAEQLDLDTMLAEGALLIEWPERLGNLIPKENLWIQLQHVSEEERKIQLLASGARYNSMLDAIRQTVSG
jgi:tRNA threonylcarbamoyladenosine biosynthesis protein TsaE